MKRAESRIAKAKKNSPKPVVKAKTKPPVKAKTSAKKKTTVPAKVLPLNVAPLKTEAQQFRESFTHHLTHTLAKDQYTAKKADLYLALAYSIRDILAERWLQTQRSYYDNDVKRVYYISMEFLMGRTLGNSLINLGIMEEWTKVLKEFGIDIHDIGEEEWDAGLGNGGLGRLAACFLDSMATMQLSGYGYGIRYEYGMFRQMIVDGQQVEHPDNWLRYDNPWEFARRERLFKIQFGGRVEEHIEMGGVRRFQWVDTHDVMALAYDVPVPAFGNNTVNTLRLWSAKASRDFELESFNRGNYVGAVEGKIRTENISKVLYPADHVAEGRELRLRQEYFLAAATVRDIFYRFEKHHRDLSHLPEKVAIQLNDTHPVLAIPELLRILMDEKNLSWEKAWELAVSTFAYTNHTVMQEALERWPVALIERVLPRHLQIIYQINDQFLKEMLQKFPHDLDRMRRMSIIGEDGERHVRMAHLAIVGSHSVNGVSALHSQILKDDLFADFFLLWPERFNNKTNGITQRRWLKLANPGLSDLINGTIGDEWTTDLSQLSKLKAKVKSSDFQKQWMEVKRANKVRLANYILQHRGLEVSPDSLFDVQVKRIHEYKRQILNVLHVIARYNRLKSEPHTGIAPRTVIFAGKAAPSYFMAKLTIRLINAVADKINTDPQTNKMLKAVFLENYNVSLAELIMPAADLSEQISTAGTEASGTGNMKFALNGALTIGTLDGANIEIKEEVGDENIFIFGMNAQEVTELWRKGYRPHDYYMNNAELKQVLDMISSGFFSPHDQGLFRPITDLLLSRDPYAVLADFASYVACQDRVDLVYRKQDEWAKRSILNTAGMGKFSSDRTIGEYAREIWGAKPSKR